MDLRSVYNDVEAKAAEHTGREQGDYIVDGLLYCGKCNTPKQCRIEVLGQSKTPYCLCKCEIEHRNKEEAAIKRREFEKQVANMRIVGFPDEEIIKCNFANDDGENSYISRIMHKYVDDFPEFKKNGKGLLLYGTVGTGKTFAAACVANALIDKGFPCLVTNFARLTNTISGLRDNKQAYIDGLNKFDLLVIDDLASERDTEYMNEIVQNIIDSRYRAGLPLIITTNLTSEELKSASDIRKQRIYSRLFDMCLPVEVKGKDRRRGHLKVNYKAYRAFLGLDSDET